MVRVDAVDSPRPLNERAICDSIQRRVDGCPVVVIYDSGNALRICGLKTLAEDDFVAFVDGMPEFIATCQENGDMHISRVPRRGRHMPMSMDMAVEFVQALRGFLAEWRSIRW